MPRDPRTYITVHDGMPEHPKIEGLSDSAFRLLITAWCWCSRQRTDGFIPTASWEKKTWPARARAELLAAGLVAAVPGGYAMHDYTEHQRTAQEIDELSAKRAAAGRKGGETKAMRQLAKDLASASHVAKQTPSKVVADTETDREELLRSSPSMPRKRGQRLPEGWNPDRELVDRMRLECPGVDLQAEHRKFVDYWAAKTGAGATKADWPATWRNWIRTAAERAVQRPASRAAADQQHTDDMFARAYRRAQNDQQGALEL